MSARGAFLDLMRSPDLDVALAASRLSAGKQAANANPSVPIQVPDKQIDAVLARAHKSASDLRTAAQQLQVQQDVKVACVLRMAELVNQLTPC